MGHSKNKHWDLWNQQKTSFKLCQYCADANFLKASKKEARQFPGLGTQVTSHKCHEWVRGYRWVFLSHGRSWLLPLGGSEGTIPPCQKLWPAIWVWQLVPWQLGTWRPERVAERWLENPQEWKGKIHLQKPVLFLVGSEVLGLQWSCAQLRQWLESSRTRGVPLSLDRGSFMMVTCWHVNWGNMAFVSFWSYQPRGILDESSCEAQLAVLLSIVSPKALEILREQENWLMSQEEVCLEC